MGRFWLVSVPAAGNKQATFAAVRDGLGAAASGTAVSPLVVPELKVGTLDVLVKLSDDLAKTDQHAESAAKKLVDLMKTLLNNDVKQVEATLVVGNRATDDYVRSFAWNAMKYRTDKPLRELADAIHAEVAQVDATMKQRTQAYNQVKTNLQAIERKTQGNLAVKSLVDVVRREHFVLDSEYLTTLLVAVPRQQYASWINSYETLTQLVVPRSSQKIAEDDEYGLFTVTLFQKVADEFTQRCRENKYTPREHKFDDKDVERVKRQKQELQTLEKEHWGQLLRLTKANFSEIFACWVHVKCVRIFVESILRYGLPPDFVACVVEPPAGGKQDKKAKQTLNGFAASHAGGGSAGQGGKKKDKALEAEFEEMSLLAGVDTEMPDFVYFPLEFAMA